MLCKRVCVLVVWTDPRSVLSQIFLFFIFYFHFFELQRPVLVNRSMMGTIQWYGSNCKKVRPSEPPRALRRIAVIIIIIIIAALPSSSQVAPATQIRLSICWWMLFPKALRCETMLGNDRMVQKLACNKLQLFYSFFVLFFYFYFCFCSRSLIDCSRLCDWC